MIAVAVISAVATLVLATPGVSWADDSVPPGQGCCFSFDHSPVVICMTADACRFGK